MLSLPAHPDSLKAPRRRWGYALAAKPRDCEVILAAQECEDLVSDRALNFAAEQWNVDFNGTIERDRRRRVTPRKSLGAANFCRGATHLSGERALRLIAVQRAPRHRTSNDEVAGTNTCHHRRKVLREDRLRHRNGYATIGCLGEFGESGVVAANLSQPVKPVLLVGVRGVYLGSRKRVRGRMLDATAHVRRLPFPLVWDVSSTSNRLVDAGAFVSRDLDLAGFTTLRVGGPAPLVAECATTQSLVDCVRLLDAAAIPTLLIAGGSNLVIGDSGWDGVVVRIATAEMHLEDTVVTAQAGAVWDDVVAHTVEEGRGGLECLSGIPGSAGATPVQNVGAYGVEVGSVLHRVQLLDRVSGEIRWVEPAELALGYRTSILKHSDAALVLEVQMRVSPDGLSAPIRYRELTTALNVAEGGRASAAAAREAVLALRRSKGMVLDPDDHDTWSAGSFFTNPVVPHTQLPDVLAAIRGRLGEVEVPTYPSESGVKLSAGWLIERAGFTKGYPGDDAAARLSTKHTLAVTNRGTATASDLVDLARAVRAGVEESFGVRLLPEPVTVGFEI